MRSRFLALSALLVAVLTLVPGAVLHAAAQEQGSDGGSSPSGDGGGDAPADAGPEGIPTATEWLDGTLDVAIRSIEHVELTGDFGVHKASFRGSDVSADDLRGMYLAAQEFGQGDFFLQQVEDALASRLERDVKALFPHSTVQVDTATLVRESLEGRGTGKDEYHEPVRFLFEATVLQDPRDLGIGTTALSLDDATVQTLLDLGVRVRLDQPLQAAPGWNVTYLVSVPGWMRLAEAGEGERDADETQATWELTNWLGEAPLLQRSGILLTGRAPPPALTNDASVALSVDMEDIVGLSLPGLLGGDLGDIAMRIRAEVTFRALVLKEVPVLAKVLEAQLPGSIELDGLTADGFRLALREGLLPEGTEARLEEEIRRIAEARLARFGATDLALEGGFASGTLDAALISDPLDADPPVTYVAEARIEVPLEQAAGGTGSTGGSGGSSGGGSGDLRGATSPERGIAQRQLRIGIPAVEGLDTTYRVTLPAGIVLADVQANGARMEQGREDGRDYVVFHSDDPQASAVLTFAVTSGFVVDRFANLGLGLVVLGIAAGGALAWRRHRNGLTAADGADGADGADADGASPTTSDPDAPTTSEGEVDRASLEGAPGEGPAPATHGAPEATDAWDPERP